MAYQSDSGDRVYYIARYGGDFRIRVQRGRKNEEVVRFSSREEAEFWLEEYAKKRGLSWTDDPEYDSTVNRKAARPSFKVLPGEVERWMATLAIALPVSYYGARKVWEVDLCEAMRRVNLLVHHGRLEPVGRFLFGLPKE